jgi:hypothetical protein
MTITPTSLIAAQGLINGQGLVANTGMTTMINTVQSNTLASNVIFLSLANVQTLVSGLGATINTFPVFLSNLSSAITNINTQANGILPSTQSFISLYMNAVNLASTSAEYAAALSQFSTQTFGNLGIGVKNYNDVLLQGITGISTSFAPVAIVNGYTPVLTSISQGLLNFGTLYDFTSPDTFGPVNLITSLQAQGLADTTGINNSIVAANYDPANLSVIPPSVLINILSNIQGSDLQKIISQTQAIVDPQVQSVADLLNATYILPPLACQALGLNNNNSVTDLANSIINIGVRATNYQLSNFIGNLQIPALTNITSITQPLPLSVSSALSASIGTGAGLFGNPTMSDLLGTIAGNTHLQSFTTINNTLNQLLSSAPGQYLNTLTANLVSAYNANVGVSGALSSLSTGITVFNGQVAANATLSSSVTNANNALLASQEQIIRETTNLSLGGINLFYANGNVVNQSSGNNIRTVLSFTSSLQSYGVDNQHLGHEAVLENMVANNITGDAIKASLAEGKNVALAQALGKKTSSVANQTAAILAANA